MTPTPRPTLLSRLPPNHSPMTWVELASVTDVAGGDATYTFSCDTRVASADHPDVPQSVPLTVEFLDERTVRLVIRPNPETTTRDVSPLELDYDAVRADVDVAERRGDDGWTLRTDALAATVEEESADLRIETRDGTPLLDTSQDHTDARGNPVAPPVGFREVETDNWPLTVDRTALSYRQSTEESFYGLGEQFGTYRKEGQRLEARVTQPNGTNSSATYAPVPFFLSDRGYGLFVDTAADATFDFGASAPTTTGIEVEDDVLVATLFYGPAPADVLESYTALTGRAPSLPAWTYGTWMSRNSYESQAEVESIAGRLREEGFPCDVLHVDPQWLDLNRMELEFDEEAFPNPGGMLDALDERGFRVSLWEYPYVKVGTDLFAEAVAEGYVVSNGRGRPYLLRRPSVPITRAAIVDFTDPDAVEWWREQHEPLLRLGVDVFKTDFGEYLPEDAVAADGRSGAAAHNPYPLGYQRAVAGAFDAVGKPPVLWSRSAWAGAQRYPVHWGGDASSTFDGFATSVRAGLSLCLSGFQFWSCDIGGYKPEPSDELYVRWAQWGLLALSHPRFHGKTPREPWEYGEEAAAIVHEFARLRYRLLPYYHSYGERATRTGLPVMRPMVLEFPDEPIVQDRGTQHMVGSDLLIAPVTDPGGTVPVSLPSGEWVDFWSGEYLEGPARLERDVPLSELPLFVRAGALIPERSVDAPHTLEGVPELTLRAYPEREGPTDAAFEFAHPALSEPVDLRVALSSDGSTVEIETDEAVAVDAVVVESTTTRPETVELNGSPLEDDRTTLEPDAERLRIALPADRDAR